MKVLFAAVTGGLAIYLSVVAALCIVAWGKYPEAFAGYPVIAALVMVVVAAGATLLAFQVGKQ